MAAVQRNGHGLSSESPLQPAERATEALLMGLRLGEGVNIAEIATKTGFASLVDENAIQHLEELGLLSLTGTQLCVTERGVPLLDAILAKIIA